jgi:hypothetical protein
VRTRERAIFATLALVAAGGGLAVVIEASHLLAGGTVDGVVTALRRRLWFGWPPLAGALVATTVLSVVGSRAMVMVPALIAYIGEVAVGDAASGWIARGESWPWVVAELLLLIAPVVVLGGPRPPDLVPTAAVAAVGLVAVAVAVLGLAGPVGSGLDGAVDPGGLVAAVAGLLFGQAIGHRSDSAAMVATAGFAVLSRWMVPEGGWAIVVTAAVMIGVATVQLVPAIRPRWERSPSAPA